MHLKAHQCLPLPLGTPCARSFPLQLFLTSRLPMPMHFFLYGLFKYIKSSFLCINAKAALPHTVNMQQLLHQACCCCTEA